MNNMDYINRILMMKDQEKERISEAKTKAESTYHPNLVDDTRMHYQHELDAADQCQYSLMLNG